MEPRVRFSLCWLSCVPDGYLQVLGGWFITRTQTSRCENCMMEKTGPQAGGHYGKKEMCYKTQGWEQQRDASRSTGCTDIDNRWHWSKGAFDVSEQRAVPCLSGPMLYSYQYRSLPLFTTVSVDPPSDPADSRLMVILGPPMRSAGNSRLSFTGTGNNLQLRPWSSPHDVFLFFP